MEHNNAAMQPYMYDYIQTNNGPSGHDTYREQVSACFSNTKFAFPLAPFVPFPRILEDQTSLRYISV